ncbi:CocE/NonD family hydrolase [Lacticaseibacillus zhaodongensis]|uniref:CocE/NonD family hydrolase n=1 Tax=Lacticaseibacillus zhaodongensis TaxID=2668065 RepID=UPI0012D35EC0|nr:CocE/NonD family hydrolase [Lacticaseibacillus zhaodongensis]
MTKWRLYISGMQLAEFTQNGQDLQQRPAGTGAFTELDAQGAQKWAAQMHFNPLTTLRQWADVRVSADAGKFTTPWGKEYEQVSEFYWINRNARPALDIVVAGAQVVGFQLTTSSVTVVLVVAGYEDNTVIRQWRAAKMVHAPWPISAPLNVQVPMRDGVMLGTTVILPADTDGPFSIVMERTPYDRRRLIPGMQRFVQRGYAVVLQDVRGRSGSEGEWVPMKHERDDGADTLNWIAQQPWSNGRVGMIGGSYDGYVQWAAAASGNPHLKAIVSMVTAGGPFTDILYRKGMPMAGLAAWFFAVSSREFTPQRMVRDDWDELLKVRPLSKIPEAALGHDIPGYTELLQHQQYDDYLADFDWQNFTDKITVPAFIQSGWYDDDAVGTTEAMRVTADYQKGQRKIVLGPWLHGGNAQYDLGDIHLSPAAVRHDMDLQHMRWFDHFLNDLDNGITAEDPVEYYTMNDGRWHTADHFEDANGRTQWFLDAQDQSFKQTVPAAASQKYDYDPAQPTPQLVDVSSNEFAFPNDYAQVEAGSDVVSFTTEPLTTPLTITGWFKVHFFARSSAVDTDWVVRLTDVTPDGKSLSIVDGMLNAKARSNWRNKELLTPGQIYEYDLETQKTSYMLEVGHRLRLDFCSAAANLVFPNSNTAAGANSLDGVVAHQEILTGGDYPSAISFYKDTRFRVEP